MGALHEGHVSLIRQARSLVEQEGAVIASIFVNPTQFDSQGDFATYPRCSIRDLKACEDAGVDFVFAPSEKDMYAGGHSTEIRELSLSQGLLGALRPGHFQGVCTVVCKLFNIVCPDIAIFGEKDFQQLAIIRRMVQDLNFPVQIVAAPTCREADGLAMSSRNVHLNSAERAEASVLYRSILSGVETVRSNGAIEAGSLKKSIRQIFDSAPLAKIDYLEVVDAETLQAVSFAEPGRLIAGAVTFGSTRLIDSMII